MASKPPVSGGIYDFLFSFEKGVNSGVAPQLLPRNQLVSGTNITLRGDFIKPRPPIWELALTFTDPTVGTVFQTGLFQGGAYFTPDNGVEGIIVAVSGQLFQIMPSSFTKTAVVTEIPIAGGAFDATTPIIWMFQAEKWMIVTGTVNLGVPETCFIDLNAMTARYSNYGVPTTASTTTASNFTIPAINTTVLAVPFTSVVGLSVSNSITIQYAGTFIVQKITGSNVDLLNVNASQVGQVVASGRTVSWASSGTELPPGRMGAYGMGRVALSLPDGKQFVMGDAVTGPSGTQAENFRDAVLNITENALLVGGGNFCVPGSLGSITSMTFMATLDASLGQGPLQVGTHLGFFSCAVPTDRTIWASMTNPILTQSMIDDGPESQDATVNANSDLLCRSSIGLRSLKLARQDFGMWGNVTQSNEVDNLLSLDNPVLLEWGSAIVFDNRYLIALSPQQHAQGVYHKGIIALNFDPLSSLSGKQDSIYDGLWLGVRILKLVKGKIVGVNRGFAITLGDTVGIGLAEILPDATTEIYDNGTVPITLAVAFPPVDFGKKDPRLRSLMRLLDGEVYVDNLRGVVTFEWQWRPDQYPCWTTWFKWTECQDDGSIAFGNPNTGLIFGFGTPRDPTTVRPGFRPRMGLGQPSPDPCDSAGRPLREGYIHNFRLIANGHFRFLGAKFLAVEIPEQAFATPQCLPYPCPPEPPEPSGGGDARGPTRAHTRRRAPRVPADDD